MKFVLLLAVALLVTGCDEPTVDPETYTQAVAVEAAAVSLAVHAPERPDPSEKNCAECSGTGRVKTGDGISTTACDRCDGTGKITALAGVGEVLVIKPEYTSSDFPAADVGFIRLAALNEPLPGYFPEKDGRDDFVVPLPAVDIPTFQPARDEVCVDGSCATLSGAASACASGDCGAATGPVRRTVGAFRQRRPARRLVGAALRWRPLRALGCCR